MWPAKRSVVESEDSEEGTIQKKDRVPLSISSRQVSRISGVFAHPHMIR